MENEFNESPKYVYFDGKKRIDLKLSDLWKLDIISTEDKTRLTEGYDRISITETSYIWRTR